MLAINHLQPRASCIKAKFQNRTLSQCDFYHKQREADGTMSPIPKSQADAQAEKTEFSGTFVSTSP